MTRRRQVTPPELSSAGGRPVNGYPILQDHRMGEPLPRDTGGSAAPPPVLPQSMTSLDRCQSGHDRFGRRLTGRVSVSADVITGMIPNSVKSATSGGSAARVETGIPR